MQELIYTVGMLGFSVLVALSIVFVIVTLILVIEQSERAAMIATRIFASLFIFFCIVMPIVALVVWIVS
jgi:hypothetical protein